MTTDKHTKAYTFNWESTFDSLIDAGSSPSTKRAFTRDCDYFAAWVKTHLHEEVHYPTKVEHILAFCVYHLAEDSPRPLKVSSIRRYLSMLSVAHSLRGLVTPTKHPKIKLLLRRTRALKKEQPRRKTAITISILKQMIATCDDSLMGIRDKALLLTAFYGGGRRREEIVNLNVEDLTPTAEGFILCVRKSKSDPIALGLSLPLTGQTATALKTWLIKSGIREGKLFRGMKPGNHLYNGMSGKAVNNMVKKRIKMIGLNPDHFGAHSLRAGFVTSMIQNGMSIYQTMQYTGHHDVDTVQDYVRLPGLAELE